MRFLPLLLVLVAAPALAQTPEPKVRFMMLNQNVCPDGGDREMIKVTNDLFAPVLNEMKAEGHILDWGVLSHMWGDEYNFNWYIKAESLDDWQKAWNEMTRRLNTRHPDWMQAIRGHCTMHKDNLYMTYDWDE